jgi:hypothetical protein
MDFSTVETSPTFQQLASQGILLTAFNAVTHPSQVSKGFDMGLHLLRLTQLISQPNYLAAAAGDYFGMADNSTKDSRLCVFRAAKSSSRFPFSFLPAFHQTFTPCLPTFRQSSISWGTLDGRPTRRTCRTADSRSTTGSLITSTPLRRNPTRTMWCVYDRPNVWTPPPRSSCWSRLNSENTTHSSLPIRSYRYQKG